MVQTLAAGDDSPHSAQNHQAAGGRGAADLPRLPDQEVRIRPGSLGEMLATVPHLLGFRPQASLVVIGTGPPRDRVRVTLRYDLPDPPGEGVSADIAAHAVGVIGSQPMAAITAVGYGPQTLVDPLAEAFQAATWKARLDLRDFVRVESGRYWSYLCRNEACCPGEGTPFDPDGFPAAAALDRSGQGVLADRAAVAARVAPLGGIAAVSMRQATRRAEAHARRLLKKVRRSSRLGAARRMIAADGLNAVSTMIGTYRAGGRYSTDYQIAWITVALKDLRVRDDAWARMDPKFTDAHRRLWTDVTRRAQPGHVAAPASLLALAKCRYDQVMVPKADDDRSQPVRAGVYERVSKLASAQDDREVRRARSIEEQNKANSAECERQGWQITARYADPGLSASRFATKDRPEYKRLLADVEAGKLDVVVLWESSRGGRELAAWAQFLNACRENRTGIYITTHGRLYDVANGRDWRSLAEDGVDSGYESEKTSMRIRRHVAAAMLAGAPFGHCPYGYERDYDPKTRELIEQRPSTEPAKPGNENRMTKADVVCYIFRELSKGTPISVIRRWLNEKKIPAPEGGEWGRSIIQRIARNPVYIGKRTWLHHEGLLDGNWAPIVDDPTFWAVQRLLNNPKRLTTRAGGVRHMLSFLAKCGQCEQELVAAGPSKKNTTDIYRCPGGHVHIRADWLDEYIVMVLAERISRQDAYTLTANSDGKATSARAEVAELKARLDEHTDLAADGKITALSFSRIEQQLLAKIAAAEHRVELSEVPAVFREVAGGKYEEVKAKIDGLAVAGRKELCRSVFAQISVNPRLKYRRPRPHRGRFDVRLTVGGKDTFFGSYATMAEAIEVRNAKYAELGIPVPEDGESTPSWRGFNPERVIVKWREELQAVADSSM